jgi:hypothetical protein
MNVPDRADGRPSFVQLGPFRLNVDIEVSDQITRIADPGLAPFPDQSRFSESQGADGTVASNH